jgi:hypothetical protein
MLGNPLPVDRRHVRALLAETRPLPCARSHSLQFGTRQACESQHTFERCCLERRGAGIGRAPYQGSGNSQERVVSKGRRRNLAFVPTPQCDRIPARGRVVHDPRGNAVWDWAIATGVLAKKTVGELISTLHAPDSLKLESEAPSAQEFAGDPYNRSSQLCIKPRRSSGQ